MKSVQVEVGSDEIGEMDSVLEQVPDECEDVTVVVNGSDAPDVSDETVMVNHSVTNERDRTVLGILKQLDGWATSRDIDDFLSIGRREINPSLKRLSDAGIIEVREHAPVKEMEYRVKDVVGPTSLK